MPPQLVGQIIDLLEGFRNEARLRSEATAELAEQVEQVKQDPAELLRVTRATLEQTQLMFDQIDGGMTQLIQVFTRMN